MKFRSFILAILATLIAFKAAAFESRLPSFLPDYYRSAFDNANGQLAFVEKRETNLVTQFVYSIGPNEALFVENIKSDSPAGRAVFKNILTHLNVLIATNKGAFAEVTDTEFHAEVGLTNMSQTVFVYLLPDGVHVWTHSTSSSAAPRIHPDFKKISACVERQRYEEATREGIVTMGQWRKSIHSYEKELLTVGRKSDAIAVLTNLLAASPFDYEAHLDLIDNAPDSADATNSAKAIYKNAEDQNQITRAAAFIGIEPPKMDKIPLLSSNDTGFEVVLIPVPPCNPWLVSEAAKVYEGITGQHWIMKMVT